MTWIPRPRVSFLKSEDGAHGGIGVVPDIMPALHNVRLLTHKPRPYTRIGVRRGREEFLIAPIRDCVIVPSAQRFEIGIYLTYEFCLITPSIQVGG